MSRTGDLLQIQDIDDRGAHDRAALAAAEAAIAGDPELDRLRLAARRAARARREVEAELAAEEAVVEGIRRRVAELNRHLYDGSVRNPQELMGMQHELDALRIRLAEQEDLQLALMERVEEAASAARDATAGVVGREQGRAGASAELTEVAVALRTALEQHERDRAEVLQGLNPADVALYERLRRRVIPAVVRLVGDACGGCHLPFANSEVRAVRSGDTIMQCSNCDRIVVS